VDIFNAPPPLHAEILLSVDQNRPPAKDHALAFVLSHPSVHAATEHARVPLEGVIGPDLMSFNELVHLAVAETPTPSPTSHAYRGLSCLYKDVPFIGSSQPSPLPVFACVLVVVHI
jgi:hypothetical protein